MEAYKKRLASNIIILRTYYGVSRTALAKLMHIPICRLRRIEKFDLKAKLYDYHLLRLVKIFDVSADALFYTDIRESLKDFKR